MWFPRPEGEGGSLLAGFGGARGAEVDEKERVASLANVLADRTETIFELVVMWWVVGG